METVKPSYTVIDSPVLPNESRGDRTDNPDNPAGRTGSPSSSDGSERGNSSGRTVDFENSDVVKATTDRIPTDQPPGNPNTGESGDTESNDTISQDRGDRVQGTSISGQDVIPTDWEDINNRINEIWQSLLGIRFGSGSSLNLSNVGNQILGFIQSLSDAIKGAGLGLDNVQRTNLASQIYNMASGYMQMQLQEHYARENWLFETEYNSPINQISRLIEAGINPAFYYSAASKDTAGEIGGVDPSDKSLTGVDGENETQRSMGNISKALSMLGTVGNVAVDAGNLTNLTSQAQLARITGEDIQSTATGRNAQTFANASYLSSLANKETVTLPLLKEQMHSTSNLNNAMIENYAITANQRWAEISNAMKIADKQIESSQFIAKLRANADKEIADMTSSRSLQGIQFNSQMAYLGTKYSADKNYAASKYATDKQVENSRWCKNMDRRIGFELKALDNMYDDLYFTNYIDETTGQRSHDFAGLGFKPSEYANVSFGTDGTATINGHRIRRDEYKTHVFRYDRMERANQTILNLVRYNDENYVPSSTMFHYAKEYDNIANAALFKWSIPKVSAAYGSYLTDQFMNTAGVTDGTQGNYEGFINQLGAGGLTTGWHK